MTEKQTARNAAAAVFVESVKDAFIFANDTQMDPAKLASGRARAREIVGITAERLVSAARAERAERIAELRQAVGAKRAEFDEANARTLKVRNEAIATMEATYGSAGIGFAQTHPSTQEQAAHADAMRCLDAIGQIESEIRALEAVRDDNPLVNCSVKALASYTPESVAMHALAYRNAVNDGKLVE